MRNTIVKLTETEIRMVVAGAKVQEKWGVSVQ